MDKPSISDITDRWIADNGGKINGDRAERTYLYLHLFAALHFYGYGKEEVRLAGPKIRDACYNQYSKGTAEKKAAWKSLIAVSFNDAFAIFTPWAIEMPTLDVGTMVSKTQYQPMPDNMKTAERVAKAEAEIPDTNKTLIAELEAAHQAILNSMGAPPVEWKDVDMPEPVYDEELLDLFGLQNE